MKHFLVFLTFCLAINFNGFSQATAEPQPFPLSDFKITFYESHMNAETVYITLIDGNEISGNQPKIIFNETDSSFTIDFTDCSEGKYLISGKRDDVELAYSVDR